MVIFVAYRLSFTSFLSEEKTISAVLSCVAIVYYF